MSSSDNASRVPIRRPPPPFRRLRVRSVEDLSPHMKRIVLGGEELEGLEIDEPAASVRLLVPPPGGDGLVMPEWTGNEFVLPGGERAPIRTFTPRFLDPDRLEVTLDVVIHEQGVASDWAVAAEVNDEVAVSGPARGYQIDPAAAAFLLAGDETAIAAISQLVEEIPSTAEVLVHIEVTDMAARIELPSHPRLFEEWHVLSDGSAPGTTLVDFIAGLDDVPERVWVSGEAAAVQKIRKNLYDQRGLSRRQATVRGYWKQGRSAT